jgi:hypothetical protein
VGTVIQVERRRLLIKQAYGTYQTGIEYAPDGQFGPIPGYNITGEQSMSLPAGAGELVRLVRENGPPTWDPQLATRLSEAAGISNAEAVYLLAGLPQEVKAADLGLSATLLDAAREALGGYRQRGGGVDMLLPEDVATLWTDGPRLDLVVARRIEQHGRRKPIPDELLELVHRAGLTRPGSASELLHGIANADTCRWLNGTESFGAEGVATAIAQAVPWLAYQLPLDHPLRAHLPGVLERARQRLRDPKCLISIGYVEEKKVDRIVAALGGNPTVGPDWIEVGPVRIEAHDDWRTVQLVPALLSGPDDPVLPVLRTRLEETESEFFTALRVLDGDLVSLELTPSTVDITVPHDPSRSAPELVAEVSGKTGLSADAATLYLQLLALPDPTDRNVARWTGWKPARLTAARKELAATEHVVEAKRTRAGRSLFLPGGWLALRAPHLPVERWKIPLLTLEEDGSSALDVVVPVAPLPRLFELAWQRITAGDTPRFDELQKSERR